MSAMQLELPFISEDPQLRVCRAIEYIEARFEKNRKALHMKNGKLQNKIDELEYKFKILEQALCKGQLEFKF
jgi:hypothetical protein